jgi:hypothetical protein
LYFFSRNFFIYFLARPVILYAIDTTVVSGL